MSKLQELRESRSKTLAKAREINDKALAEKRELTDEENANYTKAMNDFHALGDQIKREEELDQEERRMAELATEQADQDTRGSVDTRQASTEQREERAYNRWLSHGDDHELRALQVDADVSGGYLQTPLQMVNRLLKAVDNAVVVRQLATSFQLPSAASLGVPSLDNDPADPTWVSELSTGSADSTMSFGKRELTPRPNAQRILVSNTLLRKVPSAEGIVRERLAYKMGIVQENAFMTGTGSEQPLGLFTASSNGISTSRDVSTGNTATSITFDGLKTAKGTLKGQYRNRPSTRWIFHRDAMTQISKLKDGDGRYLLQDNVAEADGMRVLGIPVVESEYAPNTFTTGLYVGLLGDLSFYWIAEALDIQIRRLVELYAASDQVGFISRSELDAMPVLEEAFIRVKLA